MTREKDGKRKAGTGGKVIGSIQQMRNEKIRRICILPQW
jgi:hypothetical protein